MKARSFFFLFVLLLTLSSFVLYAEGEQAKDSLRLNLQVGFSVGLHRLQDDGMSLSNYSGLIPGLVVALQKEKKNRISAASWLGQSAQLTAVGRDGKRANPSSQDSFQFDYHLLFLLPPSEKKQNRWALGVHTGALIRARVSPKLGNSARTYEGMAFLGPALMRQSTFQWNQRPILWRSRFSLPLVAGMVRPSLTNLRDFFDPTVPDLKSRWEQHGITSLGAEFFMLRMGTELYYPLPKGHQLHVHYTWEYFQYQKVNPIHSAFHTLTFSYVLPLSP